MSCSPQRILHRPEMRDFVKFSALAIQLIAIGTKLPTNTGTSNYDTQFSRQQTLNRPFHFYGQKEVRL